MDSNVGSDMITLDGGGTALTPGAGEVEVVSGLAANVALANMFLMTVRCNEKGL